MASDNVGTNWVLKVGGTLLAGVRDLSLSDSKEQIDTSSRDVANKCFEIGMQDVKITGTVLAGSAGGTTLLAQYEGGTSAVFLLDPTGTVARGCTFTGVVLKMDRSLGYGATAEYSFEIVPASGQAVTYPAAS